MSCASCDRTGEPGRGVNDEFPEPDTVDREPSISSRRRALGMILRGALASGFAALAGRIRNAAAMTPQERQLVGELSQFEVGSAMSGSYMGLPIVVLRLEEEFRAFSAICTHEGCIVEWNREARLIRCPCHGATFDAAGQVVAGPPPRPLMQLKVEVEGGKVFVSR